MTDRRSPLKQPLSIIFHSTSQETPSSSIRKKERVSSAVIFGRLFFPAGIVLVSQKVASRPSSSNSQIKFPVFFSLLLMAASSTSFTPAPLSDVSLGERNASWWSSSEHKRLNCRVNHFPTQIAFRMQQSGLGGKITKPAVRPGDKSCHSCVFIPTCLLAAYLA